VSALDGEQAVRRPGEKPDLIVLDIMMPSSTATRPARSPRATRRPRHSGDLLSAKGRNVDQKIGFEVGADDYIPSLHPAAGRAHQLDPRRPTSSACRPSLGLVTRSIPGPAVVPLTRGRPPAHPARRCQSYNRSRGLELNHVVDRKVPLMAPHRVRSGRSPVVARPPQIVRREVGKPAARSLSRNPDPLRGRAASPAAPASGADSGQSR